MWWRLCYSIHNNNELEGLHSCLYDLCKEQDEEVCSFFKKELIRRYTLGIIKLCILVQNKPMKKLFQKNLFILKMIYQIFKHLFYSNMIYGHLSYPISILYAIHTLPKRRIGHDSHDLMEDIHSLEIHVINSNPFCDSKPWELFVDRLPNLKRLNVTYVCDWFTIITPLDYK